VRILTIFTPSTKYVRIIIKRMRRVIYVECLRQIRNAYDILFGKLGVSEQLGVGRKHSDKI
jgi:hypothetical protein